MRFFFLFFCCFFLFVCSIHAIWVLTGAFLKFYYNIYPFPPTSADRGPQHVTHVYCAGPAIGPDVSHDAAVAEAAGGFDDVGSTLGTLSDLVAGGLADKALVESIGDGSDIDLDTVFIVPFSSGTTGMPKGVLLTHRNVAANAEQILAVEDIRRSSCTLADIKDDGKE
jgi:hypothetical protein